MSKIHRNEELYDKLSEEMAWRKKELATISTMMQRNLSNPRMLEVSIRSGIALLYAHWEGFIKNAGTYYLDFVATKALPYKELTSNFIALSMKAELNKAA